MSAAHRLAVLWVVAACAPEARGESQAASDGRYASQRYVASGAPLVSGETLLSYRRDERGRAPATTGAANPLRPAHEPAPAYDEAASALASPSRAMPGEPAAELESPAAADSPSAPPHADGSAIADATPAILALAPPARPLLPTPLDDGLVMSAAAQAAAATSDSTEPNLTEPKAAEAVPVVAQPRPPRAVSTANRRLAPLSESAASHGSPSGTSEPTHVKKAWPIALSKWQSLSTAGTGLAVVVGLFLVCMVLVRRGGGKSAGLLPSEAFAVLGRAPLTASSHAHLLRVGNKLVLVAIAADGAQPLAEVTDPIEVDRITGLCASSGAYGPAAEFRQVLAQLAREPARGFLGGEASAGQRRS